MECCSAIIRQSKILILDEATSALDYQIDSIIQSSLRTGLGKDVTVLTIAHRLQTIMDYDKIVRVISPILLPVLTLPFRWYLMPGDSSNLIALQHCSRFREVCFEHWWMSLPIETPYILWFLNQPDTRILKLDYQSLRPS